MKPQHRICMSPRLETTSSCSRVWPEPTTGPVRLTVGGIEGNEFTEVRLRGSMLQGLVSFSFSRKSDKKMGLTVENLNRERQRLGLCIRKWCQRQFPSRQAS